MKSCTVSLVGPESTSATGGRHGCQIDIYCQGKSKSVTLSKSIIEQSNSHFDGQLSWYIEKFASNNPFETTKAAKISEKIRKYGVDLLRALKLQNIVPRKGRPYHIIMEVYEPPDVSTDFRRIRWEVLADLALFSRCMRPSGVTILRVVKQFSLQNQDTPSGGSDSPLPTSRILAVTSRPGQGNDIPHRLITRPIFEIVQSLKDPLDFEILRPPTIMALEQRLSEKEKGYYRIIHLDMHGSVDDNGANLHFIINRDNTNSDGTTETSGYKAHHVPAEKVAELLVKNGVETVVLNACQSAWEGEQPNVNLARILVTHGIKTVVAMAYMVLDSAATMFTQAFYYQLLLHGLPPLFAVQCAREHLVARRERETAFGTKVLVDDYLVPVIYQSEPFQTESISLSDTILGLTPELFIDGSRLGNDRWELTGREGDLLSLELNLSLQSPICCILGPAGIGKSALVEYASKWWKNTRFIDDYIILRESEDVLESLCSHFDVPNTRPAAKIIAKMEGKKYLFICDALKVRDGDSSPLNPSVRRIFRQSKSFVLITSRKREEWHKDLSPLWEGIQPLQPSNIIALGSRLLQEHGKHVERMSPAELEAVEEIGKLAFGNPLAMKLIFHNFCIQHLPGEEYFKSLMRGRGIQIEDKWLAQTSGSQGIRDLQNLLDHSRDDNEEFAVMAKLLLPFWDILPHKELRYYYFWIVQDDDDDDDDEEELGMIGQWLSSFFFNWNENGEEFSQREMSLMFLEAAKFPDISDSDDPDDSDESILASQRDSDDSDDPDEINDHDLFGLDDSDDSDNPFSRIYSRAFKARGTSDPFGGLMSNLFRDRSSSSGSGGRVDELYPLYWGATKAMLNMLEKFNVEGFMEPVEVKVPGGQDEDDAPTPYHRLHPLLPLVLRDWRSETHSSLLEMCQRRMPQFFSYRIKAWPHSKLYFDENWKGPQYIIHTEFLTFLSAAYFILDLDISWGSIAMLVQAIVLLQKGILGDRSRHTLVVAFWETARLRFKSEISRLRPEREDPSCMSKLCCAWRSPDSELLSRFSPSPLFKLRVASRLPPWLTRSLGFDSGVLGIYLDLKRLNFKKLDLNKLDLKNLNFGKIIKLFEKAKEDWENINSEKPLLSLAMEIVSMILICNLFNHYDGRSAEKVNFYFDEAKVLKRERTRLPYVDAFVRQGYEFFVKLLEMGTRPTTSDDFMKMFTFREQFYSTLGGLGWDTRGRNSGEELAAIPYVGGMLGIKNSLSSPFEHVLAAKAKAINYMEEGEADRAREVLETALDEELHHPNSDIPYNVSYFYRGLSQVAEEQGDWGLSLQHWNEALRVENDAGYKKSWRESIADRLHTRKLSSKV